MTECDIKRCPGPLPFYKDLNCTLIYNDGDCCAWRYDCDHMHEKIRERYSEKSFCYANGHKYEIGEKMKEEDETHCRKNCMCSRTNDM